MRLPLDPTGRHWLDVDFDAGVATLGHDLGDRRSRLFEALVRALAVGDKRVDAATNRVALPTASCEVRVGGTVAFIDPVARRAETVRRLTPYEARFLAETGVAHPRTSDAIDVVLRTDLHTHYAGCLPAARLVAIGRDAGVSYPQMLLEQVGVRTSAPEVRIDELGEGAVAALTAGLSIPLDRQVPFREMQSIYRRRAPITKHLPLFEMQLRAIAEDYAAMGVRYAELSLFDVVNAPWWRIAQGCLPRIEADTGVDLRFLVAFHRTDDLEWDLDMLARIDANRASRIVVGVDFMGHETNPTADFGPQLTAVAKWADEHRPGFVVRVHAGENPAFPENVRDALRFTDGCDVQLRIGHGLYGVDDETLDVLAKRRVAVEFNLDSNYALNNLRRCPEAPIERYARAGVPIVIGTDGYGLYQTTLPLALETARLAGLSDEHARAVAAYEDTLLERRRELDGSLDATIAVPDDPPLVHFTSEVSAAKAEQRASDAARFESALSSAGVPLVEDLEEWLGGRRAVSIAGAWRNSWTRLDDDERRAIEAALTAMVASLDPDEHVIVTGGTKYGVEGALHRLEPSVPVLGTVVSSVPPEAITDAGVSAFFVAGRSFFDKAPVLYDLVSRTDGVALFFGGGPVVNDEIQTAANLRIRRLFFAGASGAAREHAALDPARVFDGAGDVLAALARVAPGAPYWHLGANEVVDVAVFTPDRRLLLIQRDADAASEPLAWALPGGFRETDRPMGTPFVATEDAQVAAVRELREETGLDLGPHAASMLCVGAFEGDGRDPRDTPTAWSRTTLFTAVLPDALTGAAIAGADDARDARWFPLDALPRLAFDHARLVREAYERISSALGSGPAPRSSS